MFFVILASVIISVWITISLLLYGYFYLIEVVMDIPFVEHTPGTAHSHLKEILEKVLHDASKLPVFNKALEYSASHETEHTYEELLAAAILNKVISKYQNSLPGTSETNISSKISTSSRNYIELNTEKEKLEDKWNHTDFETSSNSSFDEYLQSDSSLGSTKYVDRVSLTIRRQIEELSPEDVEKNINENVENLKENTSLFEKDSNWYLQKRPFRTSYSPIPVPMLVPNPTSTSKVLIGDQEIDDTSDLSDGGNNVDSPEEVHNFIVESKMVIEQNFNNEAHMSDEETSADSGVKEDRDDFSEKEKFYSEPKTDITVDDENVEDASLISFYNNLENDSEYLEKYASLPKLRNSTPIKRSEKLARQQNIRVEQKSSTNNSEQLIPETEPPHTSEFFEGRYSRREKEKWKKPIKMTNNPYTKENIEKRIKLNQIYGRDYYTRLASVPSGTKKSLEDDQNIWSRDSFLEDENQNEDSSGEVDGNFNSEINDNDFVDKDEDEDNINYSETINDSGFDVVNSYNINDSEIHNESNGKKMYIKLNTEGLLYCPNDFEQPSPKTEKENKLNKDILIEPKVIENEVHSSGVEITDHKTEKISDEDVVDRRDVPVITSENKTKKMSNESVVNRKETPVVTSQKSITADEKAAPAKRNQLVQISSDKSNVENIASTVEKQPTIINRKCDNTLIRKIYSDPVVRNFALVNREHIPVNLEEKVKTQEDTKVVKEPQKLTNRVEISLVSTNVKESHQLTTRVEISPVSTDLEDDYEVERKQQTDRYRSTGNLFSNNAFSLEFSDNESYQKPHIYRDREYNELKEKRLVASRLGDFSKSFPNLVRIHSSDHKENQFDQKHTSTESLRKHSDNETPVEQSFISVKNLKKLFENNVSSYKKDKPVHSLTARSISKQMKENLKNSGSEEK